MSAVRRPPSGSAGEVRIIGGQWRRSRLPVPARPGLRPTPDRVRETLFNWLGQDLHGWTVLDAYAGSGALGFEAGSRGAGRVVMLETDAGLVRGLQETRARLGAQAVLIERADALHWMRSAARGADRGCFDLVMLDPPFAAGVFEAAAQAAIPLLRPGGFLYLEAPAQFEPADGMQAHRHLKAGVVHAHLWITPAAAP